MVSFSFIYKGCTSLPRAEGSTFIHLTPWARSEGAIQERRARIQTSELARNLHGNNHTLRCTYGALLDEGSFITKAARTVDVDRKALNSPKRTTDDRLHAPLLRKSRTRGTIIPRRKKAWQRSQNLLHSRSARSDGAFGGDPELESNLVAARNRIHADPPTHMHKIKNCTKSTICVCA